MSNVPTPTDPEQKWNLDALLLAGIHGREAEFRYEHDGSSAWRWVTPTSIDYKKKKGRFYITGNDNSIDEVRQFRLDRIVGSVTIN
jgi:predicted DNA-binding transcriptional regulator YafY